MATHGHVRSRRARSAAARCARASSVLPRAGARAAAPAAESPFAQAVRRLRKSATAVVGFAIVLVLVLVAIFADVLSPSSPIASDQAHTFERPSVDHPLGTDQLGRDMLSRVIHGTPDLAGRGGVLGAARAVRRGPVRDGRRLLRGPDRLRHHAGDGPDPRLPDLPARDHPHGDLRPDRRHHRDDQGHRRHRHRADPDLRAAGPRQRAVDQGEGVHRGVPRGGGPGPDRSCSGTCCPTAWRRSS